MRSPTARKASRLYYNGHGDLAAEADGSGTRTALHTYTPFGAPNDTPPTNATVHRFTGAWDKQYDSTSSLVLMGARPYDPNLGRFLAVDPIDGGSLNNYDYAAQDPINKYDLGGTVLTDQGAGDGFSTDAIYDACPTSCVVEQVVLWETGGRVSKVGKRLISRLMARSPGLADAFENARNMYDTIPESALPKVGHAIAAAAFAAEQRIKEALWQSLVSTLGTPLARMAVQGTKELVVWALDNLPRGW